MSSAIRVLVVDDDPAVRASLVAFLEDEGFALRACGSVGEALDVLAREEFDVAMVDLRLGEMNGETFILLARQARANLRFLIFTGSLGYQLSDKLADIGMSHQDVLYKPVRIMKRVTDHIHRLAGKERNHGR